MRNLPQLVTPTVFLAATTTMPLHSCVPADTRPPPGMLTLTVSPSEAVSSGVMTADGWRLTFERVLIAIGGAALDDGCIQYSQANYDRIVDVTLDELRAVSISSLREGGGFEVPTYTFDDAGTERESNAVRVETLGDFVYLVLFPTLPAFSRWRPMLPGPRARGGSREEGRTMKAMRRSASSLPVAARGRTNRRATVEEKRTPPVHADLVAETLARLEPRVRRLSRAFLRDTHDAEDATQLALLDIVRGAAGFRGDCTLETWADRIAIRAATRVARQRRLNTTRHEAVDPDELPSPLPSDVTELLPRSIVSYLDDLPASRRTVLVLRHVMGFSMQEIAATTAVSVNTVKDRLRAARNDVRRMARRDAVRRTARTSEREAPK